MPDALKPLTIHHVAVTTYDPVRSARFYHEVLGFWHLDRPAFTFRGGWLHDPVSGLQIRVIEHPRPTRPEGPIDPLSRCQRIIYRK